MDDFLPAILLLFSGKRKSGKDYIAEQLQKRLGSSLLQLLRLSKPLKSEYAMNNGLDEVRLLDASEYKERFRSAMIAWGESQRSLDPYIFCQMTVAEARLQKVPLWLVTDARRPSDVVYFQQLMADRGVVLVRLQADESTRLQRGWRFSAGVDDADSECALDDRDDWNFVIDTSKLNDTSQHMLDVLELLCREKLMEK